MGAERSRNGSQLVQQFSEASLNFHTLCDPGKPIDSTKKSCRDAALFKIGDLTKLLTKFVKAAWHRVGIPRASAVAQGIKVP